MIPSNIISKKRDGKNLSKKEITWFVKSFLNGTISDAQMASLLMVIFYKDMNENEIFSLVDNMIKSGSSLKFKKSDNFIADKHSTGGIGDKISLILVPILASLDINIPMIAGRALAFTGGTIDKLESIPGYNSYQSIKNFKKLVIKNNCAIISQTKEFCPADKKIYHLRDLTGTIPSNPLICSSIMSKKISEGLNGLVLDIKVGNGAFIKNIADGRSLAILMKKIGNYFNLKTDIVFSSMDQPLGNYAGLSCEIQESITTLSNNGPKDLLELTFKLGSKILIQSKKVNNFNKAVELQKSVIKNGVALKKFKTMIQSQGGDLGKFMDKNKPIFERNIFSNKSGIIKSFNTEKIGWSLVELGCGYKYKNSQLDYSAGIQFFKKIGDPVNKGEKIYRIFNSNKEKIENASKYLINTYNLTNEKFNFKLIIDEI